MKITIEHDDGSRDVFEGPKAVQQARKALGDEPIRIPRIVLDEDGTFTPPAIPWQPWTPLVPPWGTPTTPDLPGTLPQIYCSTNPAPALT